MAKKSKKRSEKTEDIGLEPGYGQDPGLRALTPEGERGGVVEGEFAREDRPDRGRESRGGRRRSSAKRGAAPRGRSSSGGRKTRRGKKTAA